MRLITSGNLAGRNLFGGTGADSAAANTCSKSWDNTNKSSSSNGGYEQAVPVGQYWNEDDYWTCSGNPFTSTGFKCTNTSIIKRHYWSSYVYGCNYQGRGADTSFPKPNVSKHSPIYDRLIQGVTFDWVKYDHTSKVDISHIRVAAMGVICRTGTTSTEIKGLNCPVIPRDPQNKPEGDLHSFATGYGERTTTGSIDRNFSSSIKYPVGFYICIEWQGNASNVNTGYQGQYITIKNLKFKFDESDGQIILPAYKQYPTHTFDGTMEMRTE